MAKGTRLRTNEVAGVLSSKGLEEAVGALLFNYLKILKSLKLLKLGGQMDQRSEYFPLLK